VINIDAKISKHAKDLIQKYTSGLFKDATLEFYGIKTAKIKELINVDLPDIKVSGSSSDNIFLLVDDSYLHYEFASQYNKSDLGRYAGYDLRLFERDGRVVNTVIIYTADVKEADTALNIGSLTYNPQKVMMYDYDGDGIYKELNAKIKAGQELTDVDMLNLIFLPLMRNTLPRDELAVNSIKLAQTIPDTTKRNACIAAAFAFAGKYLNDDGKNKLLEVLKMSDLVDMLLEGAVTDKAMEIARNLLRLGMSVMDVTAGTGLDESAIRRLRAELNNE
jgi:hypothetical protein